jgi:plastocyanin
MRRLVLLGLAAASAAPAAGYAMDMPMGGSRTANVQIQYTSFVRSKITVLTGDTVMWSDVSRKHTVTAGDLSWSSQELLQGDNYSRRFDQPGTVQYYCRIHPFMGGEVDTFDLLLDQPSAPASPNSDYPLRGRAALPEGSSISIEGDTGSGFQPVAATTVAADGMFVVLVRPSTTTTYRAVAGAATSPSAMLAVLDRHVGLTDARRRGRDSLTATVSPSSPGATVVLQLRLRERFGWWPTQQTRLDRRSTARFKLRFDRYVPARVVLTLPDGATQLAVSPIVHVGPRR